MKIEYMLEECSYDLSQEQLNQRGEDGWKLAAILSVTRQQTVGYNEYERQKVFIYHFLRETP